MWWKIPNKRVSLIGALNRRITSASHPQNFSHFVIFESIPDAVLIGSLSVVRQFETDQAFREERLWLIRG
ncbi:MAG: hypothetical protein BGP05_07710 [Rhizobiales bacterium 62-47]|nr:MAG: hypothetical protein BGP05_07710 [Rhizobiales bacterium 62-47]